MHTSRFPGAHHFFFCTSWDIAVFGIIDRSKYFRLGPPLARRGSSLAMDPDVLAAAFQALEGVAGEGSDAEEADGLEALLGDAVNALPGRRVGHVAVAPGLFAGAHHRGPHHAAHARQAFPS
jgi:hypothetical protein